MAALFDNIYRKLAPAADDRERHHTRSFLLSHRACVGEALSACVCSRLQASLRDADPIDAEQCITRLLRKADRLLGSDPEITSSGPIEDCISMMEYCRRGVDAFERCSRSAA